MADDAKDGKSIEQHPFVEQMRPDPSAPPLAVMLLEGLAGNSDRGDWARLYLNPSLTYYAEFRREDVVYTEAIPAEQSPIAGRDATRVGIGHDAVIEYTRTTRAKAQDDFDLDIQLAAGPSGVQGQAAIPITHATCPDGCVTARTDCICPTDVTCDTCRTRCGQLTCHTCQTRCGQATCNNTCQTCQTQCGQATCNTCQTCQTQCGQATCQTCRTQCGQATCHTCQTRCGQDTCVTCNTCDTCNPHVFTCGPNPQCRF